MRWPLLPSGCLLIACGSDSVAAPDARDDRTPGTVDAASEDSSVPTPDGASIGSDVAASGVDGGPSTTDSSFVGDVGSTADAGAGDAGSRSMWVIGYYSGFGTSYPVTEIDWSGLTHLAVAFYLPDTQGNIDESISQGSAGPALARSLVTAAHQAGKKILASLGGSQSQSMWQGSTSPANRATFEKNLKNLVTSYGFDGLDLDWEPFDAGDHAALQALATDLRAQMPTIAITMPIGCENNNSPDDLSFFGTLAAQVDRLNLMSYGVSGAWQGWKSWHSSPLHWNHDTATPIAIDSSVDDYLQAGVPPAKLGIGSGFYGECYSSPVTAPDQALGASTVVASDGTMSYANIMSGFYSSRAAKWDPTAMVPYLSFASPQGSQGCTYITYEDAQAIAAKGTYAKSRGLGGVIIWTINEGYLSSAPAGQRSPLLEAMKTAFLN
jgi:chitinase